MTSTSLADDLGTKKNFGAPVGKGQKESLAVTQNSKVQGDGSIIDHLKVG